MDATIRTLIEAKERINAISVDERLSGIRDLVAAVNAIDSLRPEDQVNALTEARRTVDELRVRADQAKAEYDDAYAWLKVLEGVATSGGAAEPPERDATTSPRSRSDRTVVSVPIVDAGAAEKQ